MNNDFDPILTDIDATARVKESMGDQWNPDDEITLTRGELGLAIGCITACFCYKMKHLPPPKDLAEAMNLAVSKSAAVRKVMEFIENKEL